MLKCRNPVTVSATIKKDKDNKESWINYQSIPFGEIKTGSSPINFYSYPRYRKPYMWPARHYVDYPLPHYQHLDIQNY